MLTFEKSNIGKLELRNHIVMAPMCMNSADDEGHVKNFHIIHYGNAAIGGVGLIIVEATAVVPEGRILGKDLGIWDDSHLDGHRKLTEVAHEFGAKIGVQLAHAGRKCAIPGIEIFAPTAVAFSDQYAVPKALDRAGIERVKTAFKEGARRAVEAGYDAIELHAAHGYLIHEFLSPLSNHRTDEYGGSRENRVRLLNETADLVRSQMPEDMPLIVRVSADDYYQGGINIDEMVELVNLFKNKFDIVHVSSGALLKEARVFPYPGYQVPFSEAIKERCDVKTIAVGLITNIQQIEEILNNKRADLVSLGRILLRDPYFLLNQGDEQMEIPFAIQRGFPSLRNTNK